MDILGISVKQVDNGNRLLQLCSDYHLFLASIKWGIVYPVDLQHQHIDERKYTISKTIAVEEVH